MVRWFLMWMPVEVVGGHVGVGGGGDVGGDDVVIGGYVGVVALMWVVW